jgi:hypothetical protein
MNSAFVHLIDATFPLCDGSSRSLDCALRRDTICWYVNNNVVPDSYNSLHTELQQEAPGQNPIMRMTQFYTRPKKLVDFENTCLVNGCVGCISVMNHFHDTKPEGKGRQLVQSRIPCKN